MPEDKTPDSMNPQFFNRPVPGSSLTRTPKSAPWQNPPKHVKLDDALEDVFSKITQPKNTYKIVKLLENGATAESIARTMALTGVAHGEWGHPIDKGMVRPMTYQIAAVAHRAGLKDFKILNPDVGMEKFQKEMAALELKKGKTKNVDPDITQAPTEEPLPISNMFNRKNAPVDDITQAPVEDTAPTATDQQMNADPLGGDFTKNPEGY